MCIRDRTQAGKDRRETLADQVMMANQDWMAFQESQVPKAGQEPPAKMEDQEDRETVASQVGQVRMVLQESQVHKVPKAGQVPKAGPESPANQDCREHLATMVPLASPVPQVHKVTQVNQVNQVNQVLQVKVTTSQTPTRPRAHPTPLKAVGVAMERAGTGRLTATATAPTKSTTNQWTLWKSNINSIVIQQDLSVLSTTNIFIMYTHMYLYIE